LKEKKQIILKAPHIDKTTMEGYFEKACLGDPNICEVGGNTFLRDNYEIGFK